MSSLVKLTTESFRDAGGSKEYPNLEIGEPILASGFGIVTKDNKEAAFKEANLELTERAKTKGYSHVFNIKYQYDFMGASSNIECSATGTGYKPKK